MGWIKKFLLLNISSSIKLIAKLLKIAGKKYYWWKMYVSGESKILEQSAAMPTMPNLWLISTMPTMPNLWLISTYANDA